jgi:hypothetical protein
MPSVFPAAALLLATVLAAPPPPQFIPAGRPVAPVGESSVPYAEVADLVLASPVIVDATVRSTSRIKGAEAATVAPGLTRFYVEADVTALIRGAGGVSPRIGYLVDLSPDAAGRLPKLKKQRVLLFARAAAGNTGQLQLVSPDAQRPWSPALDATARAIAAEALGPDAPPRITGVGNAFHVPGSLPGEGETQLFLLTADGRPVSISVLRRPGERPRWAVALAEIVDEAAAPPRPDTLLWYRLACALPAALPERSTAELSPDDAAMAREDYRFVLGSLGRCGRRGASGRSAPVPDQRDPDRFARLGDRELDDLHRHPLHAGIAKEQRLADVIRDTLDQGEVDARRQRVGRGMLQVEIILRRGQGRVRVESPRAVQFGGDRDA